MGEGKFDARKSKRSNGTIEMMNNRILKYKSRIIPPDHATRDITYTVEYKLIQEYYGCRTANRSNVPLINHIHEGDYILWSLGNSISSRKAFCLHPLIQNDEDMKANLSIFENTEVDQYAVYLALEYRNIANQYLSHRKISSIDEIKLSPVEEVNWMLLADKVQNYKDFIIYHKENHPRSDELTEYFENWLARMKVRDYHEKWFQLLTAEFPRSGTGRRDPSLTDACAEKAEASINNHECH